VQGADTRIAAPREDELGCAACTDHLVVDDVGRHADQREMSLSLPDDLVAGSDRNQVSEAFQRHGVAVGHELRNGVAQRCDVSHLHPR
jgi:hypothetical protein